MNKAATSPLARAWMLPLVFVLIVAGYAMSYSYDPNDTLDTVYWMEHGDIRSLLEFRHLVQRMLPLWLWLGMKAIGIEVSALALLNTWDFITAAASVMLLYKILHELTESRWVTFAATFGYATTHCVWVYTGSGRLYTTSMFLVFGAYYFALRMGKEINERRRWLLAFAAGTLVCFASLFWLVHFFNAVGVGLLLMLLPAGVSWIRRSGYLAFFSATGIVLALTVGIACLVYVGVPLEKPAIKAWLASAGTQPLEFNALSPMKAAFGHAQGIAGMNELPYMINGLMLKDSKLVHMASLPWQLGKFVLVWLLLTLVYLYPLWMLRRASEQMRILIVALYAPLAINLVFALGWLGTDEQRFLPTMFSQFALAALAVKDLVARVPQPRLVAGALVAALLFIAGVNLIEVELPSQRQYIPLEAEIKAVKPLVKPVDVGFSFGRDIDVNYNTLSNFYLGTRFVNTTNDPTAYAWDRSDWKDYFDNRLRTAEAKGGRVFVMDRMALGVNPPEAAWSEKQHPRPTVREFAEFLRSEYCVVPVFQLRGDEYFRVAPKNASCPANALAPVAENRP